MSKFETASPAMSPMSVAMFHKTTSGNVKESELINSGRDTTVQKSYNFNIAVFPDVMSFIQFAAHHFVAWTHSADGKGRDPVDISDIVPPDPTSLPVSSIADMYTRSMLRRRVGYPLYEPDPFSQLSKEYLRNGVHVGDVGFIREDGAFDFLFNICTPQNSFINPPNLPDGFSLESPGHSETRTMKPLPRATRLFPPTVTRTISGEYICEESDGAILELPEGAIQAEAINRGQFEALAKLHGVQWYKYTMTLGRSISNGSLYLVTSFTKCTQWGIAVFDRRCDPGQGLTFVSSPLCWESSGGFSTKVADPNQGDTPNQCVFLRGYKIMIRQDIFDALPRRQCAQRIRGGGGSDFVSRILTGGNPLARTTTSTMKKSDEVVLHANFNSSPLHPSDLINAALLSQNPDAKVALTHDDVWCDLLQDNFPKINYTTLMNIAQSYRRTIDEYGCVSLGKISDSSNVLDESSCPVLGPETPVPQESKADTDPKTAIEPTSICVEETSPEPPRKASSFRKAITKVKNLIPRPSHSRVPSRRPSERVEYQGYLPVLDTTGKPNDDKDQSVEIKNDLGEPLKPADQLIKSVDRASEVTKVDKEDTLVSLVKDGLATRVAIDRKVVKDTIQAPEHQVQAIHMTGNGVKRASKYDIQSTAVLDKGWQDGEYSNALQAASYKGAKDIVELLLDKGADVNAQGGIYGNALQAASYKGAKDIVELLLDKGADVNAQGGIYGNALQAASYKGAKDIVELLLDKGADVNARSGKYGNALQAASYTGAKDIVELLLEKGADVNARSGKYGNALQAASYKGAKDIVELLLDKGADVNARPHKHGNPLQAASYKGAKGADVNARSGKYGAFKQAASYKGAKSADVKARSGKYGAFKQAASYRGAKDILLPPVTTPSLSVTEDPNPQSSGLHLPPLPPALLAALASDVPPTLASWEVGGLAGNDRSWYRPSQSEGQPGPPVASPASPESILQCRMSVPGPTMPDEFLHLSEQGEHT